MTKYDELKNQNVEAPKIDDLIIYAYRVYLKEFKHLASCNIHTIVRSVS